MKISRMFIEWEGRLLRPDWIAVINPVCSQTNNAGVIKEWSFHVDGKDFGYTNFEYSSKEEAEGARRKFIEVVENWYGDK